MAVQNAAIAAVHLRGFTRSSGGVGPSGLRWSSFAECHSDRGNPGADDRQI